MIKDHVKTKKYLEKKLKNIGECRIWAGTVDKTSGLGRMSVDGKLRAVHRIAYELYIGLLPDDVHITQICGNRLCCKKEHLRIKKDEYEEEMMKKLFIEEERGFKKGQISEETFENYRELYGEPNKRGMIATSTYFDYYYQFKIDKDFEIRVKMRVWAGGEREYIVF